MTTYLTPPIQYGWACPKCGSVYGPNMMMCIRCPSNTTTLADNTYKTDCAHLYINGICSYCGRHSSG